MDEQDKRAARIAARTANFTAQLACMADVAGVLKEQAGELECAATMLKDEIQRPVEDPAPTKAAVTVTQWNPFAGAETHAGLEVNDDDA